MARLRVGVLGGTFDPIHLGHLILGQCAADQLKLDYVLFVPAGYPWRKAGREVTPAADRLQMTLLATADNDRFRIDEREIRREGPSFIVDTLRELRSELGDNTALFLLLGEDARDDLRYWQDPADVIALARLAVAPRGPTRVPAPPPEAAAPDFVLPDYDRLDMPYIGISSTDLRERVRRGESLRYMVPSTVESYIRERGLYR